MKEVRAYPLEEPALSARLERRGMPVRLEAGTEASEWALELYVERCKGFDTVVQVEEGIGVIRL